jgi:hypothetical protein
MIPQGNLCGVEKVDPETNHSDIVFRWDLIAGHKKDVLT